MRRENEYDDQLIKVRKSLYPRFPKNWEQDSAESLEFFLKKIRQQFKDLIPEVTKKYSYHCECCSHSLSLEIPFGDILHHYKEIFLLDLSGVNLNSFIDIPALIKNRSETMDDSFLEIYCRDGSHCSECNQPVIVTTFHNLSNTFRLRKNCLLSSLWSSLLKHCKEESLRKS
jgi:hypothetical protein